MEVDGVPDEDCSGRITLVPEGYPSHESAPVSESVRLCGLSDPESSDGTLNRDRFVIPGGGASSVEMFSAPCLLPMRPLFGESTVTQFKSGCARVTFDTSEFDVCIFMIGAKSPVACWTYVLRAGVVISTTNSVSTLLPCDTSVSERTRIIAFPFLCC